MKKTLFLVGILTLLFVSSSFAQMTLPRGSQRGEVAQMIGDTRVALVYDRPNAKTREIWGCQTTDVLPKGGVTYPCLVPYGQVWRTGADENTTFETNHDLKINGQTLPAGKYGLHTIPGKDEWTIIFSKTNDAWGSFSYKQADDQLRVMAKPQTAEFAETMSLGLENVKPTTADVVIRWANLRVPFTIDVGDVNARVLGNIREQMKTIKADDLRTPVTAANYVYSQKMTASYPEAINWLDATLKNKETANALGLKANLLAETGKKQEAIAAAERAVIVSKAANPKADTSDLEKRIADWKNGK